MDIPSKLRYHARHTWLDQSGDGVLIGLTEHAVGGLGDILYVQLPDVGDELIIGQSCGAVESHKTATDIDSPVAGLILDVNDALRTDPGLVNRDPYGAGWLFRIQATELGPTLTATEYEGLTQLPFPDPIC